MASFDFELDAAAAANPALKSMADRLMELFPEPMKKSMKPVTVIMKPAKDMRERSDDGVAYGFWTEKRREISLWELTDEYPAPKTLAHEAMHVIDDSWLSKKQRAEIMALMAPFPARWNDKLIHGTRHKYIALPSEAYWTR